MKKRLRKKKLKQELTRAAYAWRPTPPIIGSRLQEAVRRVQAFEAQVRSDAALERLYLEGQATLIKGFGQNAVERVYRGLC